MSSNEVEAAPYSASKPLPVGLAYQIFMIVISIYAVLAMVAVNIKTLSPLVRDLLEIIDVAVCLLFFIDFVKNMVQADRPWRYFLTWGWLDLISSIPQFNALRYARVARVLRIVRVIRALKATRLTTSFFLQRTRQTALVSIITIAFSLIVFASIAVLAFEPGKGGHIDTAADALWWAICTVATVGYGDVVTVTVEGKIIAVVLMTAGVGVFATMSGIIASTLIDASEGSTHAELKRLTKVVNQLSLQIESLKQPK